MGLIPREGREQGPDGPKGRVGARPERAPKSQPGTKDTR